MTTKLITLTALQFTGNDAVSVKLRRLVQDVVAAETAINTLLNAVATLQTDQATTGATVFADPAITSNFEVSGLAKNQVLQALSATSAAFAALSIKQLSDVAIASPENGQLLAYQDGVWVNTDETPSSGGTTAVNIGSGSAIYAGIDVGALAFRTIQGDGSTISVEASADTVTISYVGPTSGGGVPGPMGPPGMDGEPGEDGMMGPPGVGGGAVVTSGFTYQQAAALVSMRM